VKNQHSKMISLIVSVVLAAIFLSLSGCGTTSTGNSTSVGIESTKVIEYDQATLQDLRLITSNGYSKDWLSVSPNGAMLLYCESIPKLKTTNISDKRVDTFQIMLLKDALKPANTVLVTDKSITPTWYTNDSFIYSVIEGKIPKLIRANISGGGKVYVTRSNIGAYDVHPSVRGNYILFDTEVNKKNVLYRTNDNGSEVTQYGEGETPSWHPRNAQKFVFVKNGDIYEMDLGTGQSTKLFGEAGYRSANPKYSADGNYILFQKEALVRIVDSKSGKAREVKHWHLFAVKVDGTGLTQLTNGDVDAFCPVWGNSNTIFFVSNANGATEIYNARVNLNAIR